MKTKITVLLSLLFGFVSLQAQNNALSFDGTNDYVAIPSVATNLSSFTIEAWIKPNTIAPIGDIAILNTNAWDATNGGSVHFQIEGGFLVLSVYGADLGGSWPTCSVKPVINSWQHIAVTYSKANSQICFYRNGVLTNCVTRTLPFAKISAAEIGAWNTSRYFNGSIDEVRIWNVARTAGQIFDNMHTSIPNPTLNANLLAYYPFNQGTANGNNAGITTLTDASAFGKHGTLANFALNGVASNWIGFSPIGFASFSPVSGTIGTTTIITGSGFSSTPSDNTVYFGAVKATVSASSYTSLTVSVPAGGGSIVPVSVEANGNVAYSVASATPGFTFTNTPNIVPKYWTSTFSTGTMPFSAAVADFNNDGKADIVSANAASNDVSVLQGNGIGGFNATTNFAVGNNPNSVAVGDFNGDGKNDIVTANSAPNISILIGDGTGGFASAVNYPTVPGPYSVAVGDFNGDGKADIATANISSNNVSVFLGTGTGSFGAATNFAVGNYTVSIAIGDFNGDGKADIVTANQNSNNVSVLLGNGAGSFAAAVNFAVSTGPGSVAVGDFNGDGKADIVTTHYTLKNVNILLGNGAGSFSAAVNFTTGTEPGKVAIGDFNGDGKADLVTSHQGANSVKIMLGTGTGSFGTASGFAMVNSPSSVAVGDFNGDGKADILATHAVDNKVSVMLYTAPTVISSFSPVSGIAGATVTITGAGFSAIGSDNVVFFGALKASVSAATTTSITLTVPSGAGSVVPVSVTVKGNVAYSATCSTPTFTFTNTPNLIPTYETSATYTGTCRSFAIGDFNSDGIADMAAPTYPDKVSIFNGNGDGTFGGAAYYAVGTEPFSVAIGDFNGDGYSDLATANFSTNNVSVLLCNGAGGFAPAINFPVGTGCYSVAVGDFNRDGKADLATANYSSNNVSVLLGTGTGSFGAATNFSAGTSPYSLSVGDFNGDGKADIATANGGSNNVSVLLGTGTGSFAVAANYALGTRPISLTTGDFNDDGKTDIATANIDANTVSVLLNSGTGSFGPVTSYPVGYYPLCIAIGDFNGDGKTDICAAQNGQNSISILQGTGTGSFGAAMGFSPGISGNTIAVGDFNRDGAADIVVCDPGDIFRIVLFKTHVTVTSFSPVSGPIGTTVTISGSGFSTTPSDNIVYFGAVRASVSAATATTITVAVPAGAGSVVPVSVTVNGSVAYSATTSTPTFTCTNTPNLIPFYQTSAIYAGTYRSFVIGDFNGDGIPDMAAPKSADKLSIFTGNGDGTFGVATDYTVGANPLSVAIGDFNGDGYSDLATANNFNVSVLLSNGAGGFAPANNFAVVTGCYSVAVGDFNGDGKADLATANYISNEVSVMLGNGTGSFFVGYTTNFSVGTSPTSLSVGDFNGDGKADIATTNYGASSVSVLLGTGSGSFAVAATYGVGTTPTNLTTGDFNGDGKTDIATANVNVGTVSVLLNSGMGSFGPATSFPVGYSPLWLAIGDFNGDGKTDICASHPGTENSISILLGNGTGSFGTAKEFSSGISSRTIAVGDFNRDGAADMVVSDSQDFLSIILFKTQFTITSFSPASGPIGTTVTISGKGFSTTPSDNIVNFGTVRATVSASTDTTITVAVPAGAGSVVPVSVLVGGRIAYSTTSSTPTFTLTNTPNIVPAYLGSTVELVAPTCLATGDFNNDGNADIVTTNVNFDNVNVLLGTGTGSFVAYAVFSTGSLPYSVATGDFNGDGITDICTANEFSDNVSVLLGTGVGSFAAAINFAVGISPSSVCIGDFNGDGNTDIATSNPGSNTVSVLPGNGAGSFAPAVSFTVGIYPLSIAMGDFNSDGKADIATANKYSNNVSVLLGNGAGSFAAVVSFAVGTHPASVVVGDFNDDGKVDLITGNGAANVSVLLGTGAGTFAAAVNVATFLPSASIAIGDFNGDGKTDLVLGYFESAVGVMLGTGTGSFTSATLFATGAPYSFSVLAGDFNGDGKADIASVSANASLLTVLLHITLPTITTQAVSSIGNFTATGNGTITDLGTLNPTQYGVVWSTSTNPTIALPTKTEQGTAISTGSFSSAITGLTSNTTYYVKAYATNQAGTVYGNEVIFTTLPYLDYVWTGASSTDWNTATNWSLGLIPVSPIEVIIPTGVPNWPTFTGDFVVGSQCDKLTVQEGAQMTITGNLNINTGMTLTNNGLLRIWGDWFDEGTYIPGVGTVEFGGSGTSSVTLPLNISGYLINDDFTAWPNNWLGDIGTENGMFSQEFNNLAGGVSPEAKFLWIDGLNTRRMYQVVNTTGLTALTLQFMHSVDHWLPGYIVKIEYSTDGINWNDAGWELSPTANVPSGIVNVNLSSSPGVGSATYYIAFTVTGNLYNINFWYIDDVKLMYTDPNVSENFYRLNVNKTMALDGVSPGCNITVTGTLTLTNGLLNLGNNNLLLGANALIAGTPSAANMVVATGNGEMRKAFAVPGSFTFPVGDNTGTPEYSPVTLDFTPGTFGANAYAAVKLANAPLNGTRANYLNRYWNVAASGINSFACNASFNYLTADVTGNEAGLMCVQSLPPDFTVHGAANTTLHQLTASAISSFGVFTGEDNTLPLAYATVTTQAISGIGYLTATGNGTISDLGSSNPTQYGVVWDTYTDPTIDLATKTEQGTATATGSFSSAITGLTDYTTYYIKAYATNEAGTVYGDEVIFTTLPYYVWTGASSTDWNTAANWSSGLIPGSPNEVVIPTGVPNWPTFTGDFVVGSQCDKLTVQEGAQMTITGNLNINTGMTLTNNGLLRIWGDWFDEGTYIPGVGTVEFGGSGTSSVTLPVNTSGYLINDDFSIWPGNWLGEIGTQLGMFSQNSDNLAGGVSPEAMFTYGGGENTLRMYQVVNTTGLSELELQFRHSVDHNNNWLENYIVKIEYSTDGTNWNDAGWELMPDGNIPSSIVNLNLSSSQGVGSATYYISFTITGKLYNINYWYIDDVKLLYGNASEKFYNLIVDKTIASGGVSLGCDVTVTGTLTLTNGLLNLGNHNLLLGANALIAGTPSAANMVVATGNGEMRKAFAEPGSFTFPVGDTTGTPEYSPVTLNFTSGTFGTNALTAVKLINATLNGTTTNYLNRYWNVAATGITNFTCNASFNYLAADVTGNETGLICVQGLPPDFSVYDAANPTLHQLMASGISSFGVFTGVANTIPKTFTLYSVLVEGLYSGDNNLRQAHNASGAQWPAGVADHVTVELHDAADYATIIYSANDVELYTYGVAYASIPIAFTGSYYVTVRHRNSVQITSAVPASLAGSSANYSFWGPADVLGGNFKQMSDGRYVLYGGDVNQDGVVDAADLILIDNDAGNFLNGYLSTDVNGDGIIDAGDMVIPVVNSALFISGVKP